MRGAVNDVDEAVDQVVAESGASPSAHTQEKGIRRRLTAAEPLLSGLMLGAVVVLVSFGLYNELQGLHHLDVWEHSFQERRLSRVAEIMEGQVELARGAIQDGTPLGFSDYLANDYALRFNAHHMDYAVALLEQAQVPRFNELRMRTGFIVCDLSGRELTNLDLTGVVLAGTILRGTKFSGSCLRGANFTQADLSDADLSRADLGEASFQQANLGGAILNGVRGADTSFREAVLANASMTGISELTGARFDRAHLEQANLWQSRLPGAVLDGADLTIASAIDADLSEVKSMADVTLTGANLHGTQLNPEVMPRAWLVNAEGLSDEQLRRLKAVGGVVESEDVLQLVDRRIVAGFQAQIENDPEIRPEERRVALFMMLQDYYQQ